MLFNYQIYIETLRRAQFIYPRHFTLNKVISSPRIKPLIDRENTNRNSIVIIINVSSKRDYTLTVSPPINSHTFLFGVCTETTIYRAMLNSIPRGNHFKCTRFYDSIHYRFGWNFVWDCSSIRKNRLCRVTSLRDHWSPLKKAPRFRGEPPNWCTSWSYIYTGWCQIRTLLVSNCSARKDLCEMRLDEKTDWINAKLVYAGLGCPFQQISRLKQQVLYQSYQVGMIISDNWGPIKLTKRKCTSIYFNVTKFSVNPFTGRASGVAKAWEFISQ